MKQYHSILIINPKSQWTIRLSVGSLYKNYLVVEITKTVASPGITEAAGTYSLMLRATSGNEYTIRNNQPMTGKRFCLVGSGKAKAEIRVPKVLATLTFNSNAAEFSDPLP